MSETLQSGRHPDADQISAFVESALPAHEREQMLDHLAVCPECRAIVALSLPEVEAPVEALPAPARRPWWSGWTLAWPVAGALAASALLFISLHRTVTVAKVPEVQTAVVHAPAAPVQESSAPIAKPGLSSSQAPPAGSLAAIPRIEAHQPNAKAAGSGQAVGSAGLAGRNTTNLLPLAEVNQSLKNETSSSTVTLATPPGPGFSTGAIGGLAAPASDAAARAQSIVPAQPAGSSTASAPQVAGAAPMPASTMPAVITNNSFAVQTMSSNVAGNEIATDQALVSELKSPLPSRRPVLSVAVRGDEILAIDTGHKVFVSGDAGEHWKRVQPRWQGHAVTATLVGIPAGTATPLSLFRPGAAGQAQGINATSRTFNNAAPAPTAPLAVAGKGSSLIGTVTDQTGAAVPGASVTATEAATGTARRVDTDRAGHYIVDGLAAGNYRLEALAPGFRRQELASVAVLSTGQNIANLTLSVGESTETVTVEAESKEIDASDKKAEKLPASNRPAPVFEITTDKGAHWMSTDGISWRPM